MAQRKKRQRKLPKMALAHYSDRIVRVLGDTAGKRRKIEWVDADGVLRRSAVKGENLKPLAPQLF